MPAVSPKTRKPVPAPKPKPKAVARSAVQPSASAKPLPPTPRPKGADKRRIGGCMAVAEQRQRIARKRLDRNGGRVFGEKGDGPTKVLKDLAFDVFGLALLVAVARGTAQIFGRLVGSAAATVARYVPEVETPRVLSNDAVTARNRKMKEWKPPIPTPEGAGSGDGVGAKTLKPRLKPEPVSKAVLGPRANEAAHLAEVRARARQIFGDENAFRTFAKIAKGERVEENVFALTMLHSPALAAYVARRDDEDFGAYRTSFDFSTNTLKNHPEIAAAAIFTKMVAASRLEPEPVAGENDNRATAANGSAAAM